MKDELGDRMKADYENRTRYMLPRRTWTVIRIDGRAFHTYTKNLERPWDQGLMDDMAATTVALCGEVSGCLVGYTQSDEISLIVSDTASPTTQAWFDGNLQKIASITASFVTGHFYSLRIVRGQTKIPMFDSRVFTIPAAAEVENYLIWRQNDAVRNSIQMAGQAQFSHRELQGVSGNGIQEKLFRERGINWADYPAAFKNGTLVKSVWETCPLAYVDRRTGNEVETPSIQRRSWVAAGAEKFTQNREELSALILGEKR